MINSGYEWRSGFPTKSDANDFARQLQTLRNPDGTIDVEVVLDAQRPKDAPLHNDIVWDDRMAAHIYRIERVQGALAALRVIPVNVITEENTTPIRALLPLSAQTTEEGDDAPPARVYSFVVNMIDDDKTTTGALERVRTEAIGKVLRLARQFETVPECADLAAELHSIIRKYIIEEEIE